MERSNSHELLYVMYRFLEHSGISKAAEELKIEIERKNILPQRSDITGVEKRRSFAEYRRLHDDKISAELLRSIFEKLPQLLSEKIPPPVVGLPFSIFRIENVLRKLGMRHGSTKRPSVVGGRASSSMAALRHGCAVHSPTASTLMNVRRRELGGRFSHRQTIAKAASNTFDFQKRILGHLASVFCVIFDRTGRYIITGSDDHLVKVWQADMGLLRFTFRGCGGEIADLSVSYENTLLAAGSVDKTIRVWCLRTGNSVAVFQTHTAMVTSINFLPLVYDGDRYLMSTSNDCCVCFWKYDVNTNDFNVTPLKFSERATPSAQMICSTVSPGGHFVVTGCTDQMVRIYHVTEGHGPIKIHEKQAHMDRVDSLQWAHSGLRFVSGSKDGTAKVWRYERQTWDAILLAMPDQVTQENKSCASSAGSRGAASEAAAAKAGRLKVTMVAWSSDDSRVVTAVSDFSLRIWHSTTGTCLRQLSGHTDESFILQAHPAYADMMLSAGHDGNMFLWDLSSGAEVKRLHNKIDTSGHGAFFDACFSPQLGAVIAATDSHGFLSIVGIGSNDRMKLMPAEQFYHTDYRPLLWDHSNGYVLDEQTQLAINLMPPPVLVDSNGTPYPADLQRLVPGKERFGDGHLTNSTVRPASNEPPEVDVDGDADADEHALALPEVGQAAVAEVSLSLPTCVWLRRAVVAPLLPSLLVASVERRRTLGNDEGAIFERESKRAIQAVAALNEAQTTDGGQSQLLTSRRRKQRGTNAVTDVGGSRRQTAYRTRTNPRPSAAVLSTDYVNPDAISDEERRRHSSTSSASMSSDASDSDYEEASAVLQTVILQRPRIRTRRRVGNDDESDEENGEEDDDNESAVNAREEERLRNEQDEVIEQLEEDLRKRRRKRRRVDSDEVVADEIEPTAAADVDDIEEQQPGPSNRPNRTVNSAARRSLTPTNKRRPTTPRRSSNVAVPKRKKELEDYPVHLKSFPDWMMKVTPERFPYYPQIGDEVAYFYQGHRWYNNVAKNSEDKRYAIEGRLATEELALVDEVRFLKHPRRMILLKLALLSATTNQRSGRTFTIRYDDVDGVPDFVILRQHFDQGRQRRWKIGDRVQALIDQCWWAGTVDKIEPIDPLLPRSLWLNLRVKWDNGDEEALSGWDLEPMTAELFRSRRRTGVPAEIKDFIRLASYTPDGGEWPEHGRDRECIRIKDAVEYVMTLEKARPFVYAVDLDEYPKYSCSIEYPSFLLKIRDRLDKRFYRRVTAIEFDVEYISHNAARFNVKNSRIVQSAHFISKALLLFIQDPSLEQIADLCTDMESNPEAFVSEIDNNLGDRPVGGRLRLSVKLEEEACEGTHGGENVENGQNDVSDGDDDGENEMADVAGPSTSQQQHTAATTSSRGRQMASAGKQAEWIKECSATMERILDSEFSASFRDSEDLGFNMFDSNMDLSTISKNLMGGHYANPEAFKKDIDSLLQNCRSFATNKRSRTFKDALQLQNQVNEWLTPVVEAWKRNNDDDYTVSTHRLRIRRQPPTTKHIYNTRSNDSKPRPQARPQLRYRNDSSQKRRRYADEMDDVYEAEEQQPSSSTTAHTTTPRKVQKNNAPRTASRVIRSRSKTPQSNKPLANYSPDEQSDEEEQTAGAVLEQSGYEVGSPENNDEDGDALMDLVESDSDDDNGRQRQPRTSRLSTADGNGRKRRDRWRTHRTTRVDYRESSSSDGEQTDTPPALPQISSRGRIRRVRTFS